MTAKRLWSFSVARDFILVTDGIMDEYDISDGKLNGRDKSVGSKCLSLPFLFVLLVATHPTGGVVGKFSFAKHAQI